MIWRGYTISLLRMGGVSPRVFSSFLLERLLELHKENPTSNLQSPQILCGEQKGVNSEVSKGAEENQLGAAFGDGARGGGGGVLVEPGGSLGQPWGAGESSTNHSSTRSAPAPSSPPSQATPDAQSGRRKVRTTGRGGRVLRLPGSGGWGRIFCTRCSPHSSSSG